MTTQASEARVVCRDLLTLHQADIAAQSPSVAAKMWSLYLARYVPKIRHAALRTMASDYALTDESVDVSEASDLSGAPPPPPSEDPLNSPAADKRDADAQYLTHALCYAVDTALYKPANTP